VYPALGVATRSHVPSELASVEVTVPPAIRFGADVTAYVIAVKLAVHVVFAVGRTVVVADEADAGV
jgi:hypothetical protein